jgi:hypothetical protein
LAAAYPETATESLLPEGAPEDVGERLDLALQPDMPAAQVHRLAIAIRSATGIEALVWLTDVAGLSRNDATDLMRWSARGMLAAALNDQSTTATKPRQRGADGSRRGRDRR